MFNRPRLLKSAIAWQLLLAGYWIALFIGTHLPSTAPLVPGDLTDKLLHFAAFATLSVLLAAAWRVTVPTLTRRHLWWAWILLMLYAAFDEWTQIPVGRQASAGDWLTDAIGAAIGLIAFYWWNPDRVSDTEASPEEDDAEHRRPKWSRFSLKTFLLFVTLIAAICCWAVLPTMNAHRFAAAIRAGDYAAAETLFASDSEPFPGNFKEYEIFEPRVGINPMSWDDFWSGERRIGVGIHYGDRGGIATCGAEIRAKRTGLELVILVP